MIIVPLKEGENIERALKKFKRKFEKTGVVKELRDRQAFTKPSVRNRAQRIKAVYKQSLQQAEDQLIYDERSDDGCSVLIPIWEITSEIRN